jgi:guanosine-3',5'-bis(diphosphate) 3'-pyrophosphohydrolase
VIGPDARACEIQIRTEAMDRDANYGIVAAYRYAQRGARGRHAAGGAHATRAAMPSVRHQHLEWLHNLVQWQAAAVDPARFIESLQCDLSEGQVRVFAGGTRLLLPEGATPVDVAYALGPDIGDRCIAATVNGQLAFLASPLADGDVVEIHTQDPQTAAGPAAEWLGQVRTPRAQLHLEQRLGVRRPEHAPPLPVRNRAVIGLNAIRMELHWRERRLAKDGLLQAVAADLGYPDPETLCVAVADHVVTAAHVVDRLIEQVEGAAVLPGGAAHLAAAP